MLFNTAATREMLNKVNEEFSTDNFEEWRSNKTEFNGVKDLHDIAMNNGIAPTGHRQRKRWKHWLKEILHKSAAPPNLTYRVSPPTTTFGCAGTSFVGRELVRLFKQALDDNNCAEIVMVIQPDTKVCITQAQVLPIATIPGKYSLAITLSTIEVPPVIPAAPAPAPAAANLLPDGPIGGGKKKKR